ncbi:MAG: type II toxin-antitoxin system MqsA family antitoxin [Deltaproteobacteria bacterium]|jgi:HTH-type transcriptional regulator/antitoxin MqsA|nr:type II toxin-antitoxin system MqsA family antitoxin [Deltaproteobacteria bacterium]
MQCGSCGHKETVHTVTEIPFAFMGSKTVIKNVEGELCPECGEVFLDMEAAQKADEAMQNFKHEVCSKRGVTPEYIRQVRKKLNLGQKEAGNIFGGGANAFSRYEKGKTPPPVPLVKLLRVLDVHPELLPLVQ